MNNKWDDDEWKEWKREIRSKKVMEAIKGMELPQGEPFVVLRTKEGKLAGRELGSYEALHLLAETVSKRVWPDGSYKYVLPSVWSYFQMYCSDLEEGKQLRKAMASKKGWVPRFACREMILVDYGESVTSSKDNVKKLRIPLEGFIGAENLAQIGSSMVMKIPDRSEWEPQPGKIVLYPRVTEKPNGPDVESHNDLWFSKHDTVETSIDFSNVLGTLINAELLPKSSSVLMESCPVYNLDAKSYFLQVFFSPKKGYPEYSPNTFYVDVVPNIASCVALERMSRR